MFLKSQRKISMPAKDFFTVIVTSHILCAAMEHLDMEMLDSDPNSENIFGYVQNLKNKRFYMMWPWLLLTTQ